MKRQLRGGEDLLFSPFSCSFEIFRFSTKGESTAAGDALCFYCY